MDIAELDRLDALGREFRDFMTARLAEDEAAINDPDPDCRARLEVRAKRAILDNHVQINASDRCMRCNDWDGGWAMRWPCYTLQHLAMPYERHPDYQPRWAWETPQQRAAMREFADR